MKNIFVRTKQFAYYMIKNNATVRKTAQVFGISKSTVHYDLTKRLPLIDSALYLEVREILDKNESEKSMRGGLATKNKYLKKRTSINNKWVWISTNSFIIIVKKLSVISRNFWII